MALRTRLTEQLGILHPIISAPMGFLAGGRLAAAVSQSGGLGLIGGGYGDGEWLDREFTERASGADSSLGRSQSSRTCLSLSLPGPRPP